MAPENFDAIVLGTGQAGKPLALELGAAGCRTAVIEREHVGGTCVNVGCTPTKTMVASARVAYLARRAGDYGVRVGPVAIARPRFRERKRKIVNEFRRGSERGIVRTRGLDLIMGEARFTGPRSLEVRLSSGELQQLSAAQIFINAGNRPARPALPGLDL